MGYTPYKAHIPDLWLPALTEKIFYLWRTSCWPIGIPGGEIYETVYCQCISPHLFEHSFADPQSELLTIFDPTSISALNISA